MNKYFKQALVGIITILFSSLFIIRTSVNAQENIDPSQHEAYLNDIVQRENYNEIINGIITETFPSFNLGADAFDERVLGNSNYTILEITPRTYLEDISEISDVETNFSAIKQIYEAIILRHDLQAPAFVLNIPNFKLETMTIKQFVDSRSEIAGKYDAIIFSSGNYSINQDNCCDFEFDETDLYFKTLKQNNVIRYLGTLANNTNDFRKAIFHGAGSLFAENGELIYVGTWINGKRSCYGISFDSNGVLRYMGQWKNDLYHGYGISFNKHGMFEYMGYFENGKPGSNNDEIPESLLNDLTLLKATQITTEYIEKGLPVFLSHDTLKDQNSILYQSFSHLIAEYDNVFSFDYDITNSNNNIDFYSVLSMMKITELFSAKPKLVFNDKPEANQYQINDIVKYQFDLVNMDEANLMFYLDVNQNEVFDADELVYNYQIKRGENSLSFVLPNLYSRLLNYKFVVEKNGLATLYQGSIRVKGDNKEIKALNIVSDMVYKKGRFFDADLFTAYFQNNGDYQISVANCSVKDFKKNNSNKWECSHNTVMVEYDEIILGQGIFTESLNEPAYRSIQNQMDQGKPFIFTSSVTKGNEKWLQYFHDELALSNTQTETYKLNNKVDHLQIINDSNFVLYPFNMYQENLAVPVGLNYTLNEKYQLDLENANLIPLMNMYNTENTMYDRFDSYNNYYYTKHNNIVYLNLGYDTFEVYKDTEHKLLVNAIINLYIENKAKANKINDLAFVDYDIPNDNTLLDINEILEFSFNVRSVKTEALTYKVYVNDLLVIDSNELSNKDINVLIDVSDYVSLEEKIIAALRLRIEVNYHHDYNQTFTVYVADKAHYQLIKPKFSNYLFIPYGEVIDVRDYFTYNDEIINLLDFYLLDSENTFTLKDKYLLQANSVGEAKIEIVAKDIFGNIKRQVFDVISYETIDSLDIADREIALGQEDVIYFPIDTRSIKYELKSGNINTVNIIREDNKLLIKGNNIGEATYDIYGYNLQGEKIQATVQFTVIDANDIIFTKKEISIFSFNEFRLVDLEALVKINNHEYTIDDVEFSSSDDSILSFYANGISVNDVGRVIVEAKLPNQKFASIIIYIYNKFDENTGFRPGLEYIKIYVGVEQELDKYIIIYPENMPRDNIIVDFELITDVDNIVVDFDNESKTYNTIKAGTIKIKVTIKLYDDNENLIDMVDDEIILRIRELPDPGDSH